jgi:hypothetical protein
MGQREGVAEGFVTPPLYPKSLRVANLEGPFWVDDRV